MDASPVCIPVLLDPYHASPTSIPAKPENIVSWISSPSSTRHIAFSDKHNSLWIHSSPLTSTSDGAGPSTSVPPPLLTPTFTPNDALSPTSSASSPKRPANARRTSGKVRSRAGSFASSIVTTTSGSRRVSAFSPPPPSRIPAAVLTNTVVTVDPHEHISPRAPGRTSFTDAHELIDHLREQRDRDILEPAGIGLGLGRKIQVHSKDQIESSGLVSPPSGPGEHARSTASLESNRTNTGIRNWFKSEEEKAKEREEEMKVRLGEVEVEREMVRESEETRRGEEEIRMVERCTPTPRFGTIEEDGAVERGTNPPARLKRIVLGRRAIGRVVRLKAFEDIGVLAVLRDVGILDLVSLVSLEVVQTIHLEQPETRAGESSNSKALLKLAAFWYWRDVHFASSKTQSMLVADGVPWPCAMPSPNGEVTRVILLSLQPFGLWQSTASLELPGTGYIAVCADADKSYILHFLAHSLTSYPIIFPGSPAKSCNLLPNPRSGSPAQPSLLRPSTPNSQEQGAKKTQWTSTSADESSSREKETKLAKFLANRRGQQKEEVEEAQAGIEEGIEVERDGYGDWSSVRIDLSGSGLAIGESAVDVFTCNGKTLRMQGSIVADEHVKDAFFTSSGTNIAVQTGNLSIYSRPDKQAYQSNQKFPDAIQAATSGHGIVLVRDGSVAFLDSLDYAKELAIAKIQDGFQGQEPAAILQYDPETVLTADARGTVRKQTLRALLADDAMDTDDVTIDRLNSSVTFLASIQRSEGDLVAAGDEDGTVRVWTVNPSQLQGAWTVFAVPVISITRIESTVALNDVLCCTAADGTVAFISLLDMDLLYLIPASRAPLRRVFIDSKDILLAYANGKARVWNHITCEFRRSTGLDAAQDMLANGKWEEVLLEGRPDAKGIASSVTSAGPSDLARTLTIDVRAISKWIQNIRASGSPLPALRAVLGALLSFGLNQEIDEICETKLGIVKPKRDVRIGHSYGSQIDFDMTSKRDFWANDPSSIGLRQIAIISLLRPFLDAPDAEHHVAKVIAFYAGRLGSVQPDLAFFAEYFIDPTCDIQQAARILFKARLDRMPEEEVEAIVEQYRVDLPAILKGKEQVSQRGKKALTIVGGIVQHRYQSVTPTVLKATADSLYTYLSDAKCVHLPLAIELAHRSFAVYQTHIDPMDLLRCFFFLSTHNPPSPTISAQARLATLDIAVTFPGLFMSTLSMDILDAETLERRTSIMKLCVFMARKKPSVIQHGLPRIAESVVKSLDPNVGKMREEVQEAATVILNELVLAFSTIDFHSGTQRLAVGTREGAVIMYDLKTASRLYVLEPHHAPVSSVNFSPDGRRLVTVSLEESDVTVWKVGSSISGFFTVGGPPRQGAGKGEPFKRIEFFRADRGPMPETSALSDVRVEWPGTRQARVQIRETALTFET